MNRLLALAAVVWLAAGLVADEKLSKPGADEPRAKEVSLARAAAYLDQAALSWTKTQKCTTCHTNMMHLMARGAVTGKQEMSKDEAEVRAFFEGRAAHWDRGQKGDKPRWDTEVVVAAVALAFHDAQTTGKLHPLTRQALDRIWTVQRENGAWNWLKCKWPPMEHDDYFGAVLAAVGVGVAPDGYAGTEKAKTGLARLRAYLKSTPAPSLHHKAWLLWASLELDGLMAREEREKTINDLLALQKVDGGWSLASLGAWEGYDGRDNDAGAPSDGYGTGLVVYVVRQAGLPAAHPTVKKGGDWLRANQRISGRWFTRSLNTDRYHYISNAGTAFAILALKACE